MKLLRRGIIFLGGRLASYFPVSLLEIFLFRAVLRQKFNALAKSKRIPGREEVWRFAVNTVGPARDVLFLEFGVFRGKSMRYFSSQFSSANSRFFGFDSFEGLPEEWTRKKAGGFSTAGKLPDIADSRVEFIKGWFQNTVPAFAVDGLAFENILVHLDADLYSSTLFVLSQMWGRFKSCYLLFDEFSDHECRALYNFLEAFPCKLDFLAHDDAVNPQRVFCRLIPSRGSASL